ncbi:MAG: hypothetical protein OXR62_14275 [Ahrensia sp.]|nr:hypothetical protein [Ahrensia sp.]
MNQATNATFSDFARALERLGLQQQVQEAVQRHAENRTAEAVQPAEPSAIDEFDFAQTRQASRRGLK